MNLDRARDFTFKRLFFGDTILNWLLGFVLVLLPQKVDDVLGSAMLFPRQFYTAVGVIFLAFAAWQTIVSLRKMMGIPSLVFAAIMAEAPTVLLTVALTYLPLALYPVWRIVLWIGNIYMFILGCWYFHLAHRTVLEDKNT